MATILLIGSDSALLEGLAQTFSALGHRARLAHGVGEAIEVAATAPPLVAVIDRALLLSVPEVLRIPLVPGGALVLYRTAPQLDAPLPPSVQRAVLADLTLPLERTRLVALVRHVEERARTTGRDHVPTPPEPRAR